MSEPQNVRNLDETVTRCQLQLARAADGSPERFMRLLDLLIAIEERYRILGRMEDLDLLIVHERQALLLCPIPSHNAGCMTSLADSLATRFQRRGEPSLRDVDEAIQLYRQALSLQTTSPQRASSVSRLADVLYTRFTVRGDVKDMEEVVRLRRDSLTLSAPEHPDRGESLSNLGDAVYKRFKNSGNIRDLNEAVQLYRKALDHYPSPHPTRRISLNNLALSLHERFDQRGNPDDLNEAIKLHREALELMSSPSDRGVSLSNLAGVLWQRFRQGRNPADIDEAIALHREACTLHSSSNSSRGASINNLAVAIYERFKQRGALEDLDDIIKLYREALDIFTPPHPNRGASLNNTANALVDRFKKRANRGDLDEAIILYRDALALHPSPHPNRGGSLNNLASALQQRFRQDGDFADIDEAIRLYRKSLALRPVSHPDRGSSLGNLANALFVRFRQYGKTEDIDDAIELHREALAARVASHVDQTTSLENLATCVEARFDQQGKQEDIDEAIRLHRGALALRTLTHPERALSLNNLANSLFRRFQQRGNDEDIDEAVLRLREALDCQPSPNPGRAASLNNLANVVHERFGKSKDPKDLDEAILLNQEALALRVGTHPDRGASLNNLGNVFLERGRPEDLDEAVCLHREASKLRKSPHPECGMSITNLGNSLHKRFLKTGNANDISEAVQHFRDSLAFYPSPHPARAAAFANLGSAQESLYVLNSDTSSLDEAVSALRDASEYITSSPLSRLVAAQHWARVATKHNHASALTAYRTAINLLPRIVTLDRDINSRQKIMIARFDSLGSDAAACAVGSGHYTAAVELLEAARSIFWSQGLRLRTPLDDLQLQKPQLAAKLVSIARELEQGSFRNSAAKFSINTQHEIMSTEAEMNHLRSLSEDWEANVAVVQNLTGFEEFMRPKRIKSLQRAAAQGSVVILNAGSASCHALIVDSSGDIQCVALDFLMRSSVNFLALLARALSKGSMSTFHSVLAASLEGRGGDSDSGLHRLIAQREFEHKQSLQEVFSEFLGLLWVLIAAPIMRSLKLRKTRSPPRLWWCLTGPFAFLPIHAAGIYGTEFNDSVADYVVSSYTPTLTALLLPPSTPPTVKIPPKVTAIIEPATAGQRYLPFTRAELVKMQERIPKEWFTSFISPSSVELVLPHLQSSSIVHFACHGTQDTRNPLESALLIGGTHLKVSRIMEAVRASINVAKSNEIAFLSACETAMGDENSPDEAIHLAATLLFAGFRSVVATMWTMADEDGPEIANDFYGHLFQATDAGSNPPVFPDLTASARALHLAILKLRIEVPFVRWVPFVHYGL